MSLFGASSSVSSGVRVYQNCNYGGSNVLLPTGIYYGSNKYEGFVKETALFGANVNATFKKSFKTKDISSLIISPGYGCICYNSSGKYMTFLNTRSSDMRISCLTNYNFNDQITKIQVFPVKNTSKIIDSNGNIKEGFTMGGKEYNFIDIIVIIISILALCLSSFAVFKIMKSGSKSSLSSSSSTI